MKSLYGFQQLLLTFIWDLYYSFPYLIILVYLFQIVYLGGYTRKQHFSKSTVGGKEASIWLNHALKLFRLKQFQLCQMKYNFGIKLIPLCSEVNSKQFSKEDLGPAMDTSLASLKAQIARDSAQLPVLGLWTSQTAEQPKRQGPTFTWQQKFGHVPLRCKRIQSLLPNIRSLSDNIQSIAWKVFQNSTVQTFYSDRNFLYLCCQCGSYLSLAAI